MGEIEELQWVIDLMKSWFEIKVRGILGADLKDDKEVVVLGRTVKWQSWALSGELTQSIAGC